MPDCSDSIPKLWVSRIFNFCCLIIALWKFYAQICCDGDESGPYSSSLATATLPTKTFAAWLRIPTLYFDSVWCYAGRCSVSVRPNCRHYCKWGWKAIGGILPHMSRAAAGNVQCKRMDFAARSFFFWTLWDTLCLLFRTLSIYF